MQIRKIMAISKVLEHSELMDTKLLEVHLNEALFLKRSTDDEFFKDEEEAGRTLSIKLIDAILFLEETDSKSTFSMYLSEPEHWYINTICFDDSKDASGNSMRACIRSVWRNIREFAREREDILPAVEVGIPVLPEHKTAEDVLARLSTWKDDPNA